MTPTKELKATIANVLNLPDNSAEEKITPNRKMFSCFLSFSQDHQGFFFFFFFFVTNYDNNGNSGSALLSGNCKKAIGNKQKYKCKQ